MKRFCLALTLLPFVAFAAYDFTDLWPDQASIPHYDANQTAGQPNMMSTASYREGVRYMPFLHWQTAPKTTAPADGRPCLILISGGAYSSIADMDKITTWKDTFTALGIQCVVLYYRVPRSADPLPIYQAAWDDGQRAVRMVRSMAAARGLDPDKIGVIGMSAGSHLATLLATSSLTPAYTAVDDLDSTSAHIDVALANAIAYGMSDGLTGTNSGRGIGATLDTIFKFDENTCPMCMTHGGADSYSPLSSSMVWRRLRAMDVTAELHTYPDKDHGAYGLDRHVEFLRKLGWIPSEAAVSPATRWPDDSACAGVSNETYTAGALAWYHPAVHKTASIQILLAGPAAASQEVSDAIVYARRYLNATGITVVTAQIRSGTEVADAQAAVAAVRADAAKYGLNADYIGLMGYRADAATAVAAATTTVADNKVRWVAAISPTTGMSDAPLAAITSDTPPTVFIHEELNSTDSAVGSVASWEKQRELWDQGAVHTLAAEDADFISTAAVPGTAAYTYLDRVYDFLSEKKDLAAWTEPEPEVEPDEPVEPEPEYVQMPWFEVQFQNSAFVAGADWIAQSADPAGGTFAPASGVESELVKASADTAYVQYADDKEGEIVYTPSTASPADKSVHVTGRAKVESRTSLPAADANAAAGLCFISGFPYGFAGGSWTKIGVDSFTEGEWVDYDVEFDLASASAPRVRYTVGTSVGNWIALDGTASQVVSVRFEGGSFGNFKGTYEEEVFEPQEADPDTSWMKGSFGVSFHWTAKVVTNNGTMNWEQAVNNFNVEDFADSVESFGAQHVIFTTAHAWQQLPCPCVALDNLITGRTTERDLLKDIIDELTNRNIRVVFYYNHSCNHNEDQAWDVASGYDNITDAQSMTNFADNICAIVRELSLRYGDGVSAWWFDSATSVDDSQPWPNNKTANNVAGLTFPWDNLFAAARAGNPHAAVAVNWDVHAVDQHGLATDYLSGETEKIDVYGNYFPFAPADIQDHIWTCMDSTAWFWNGSNLNTASRFSSLDSLKAWKASHRAAGRMATLNLVIDEAGNINPVVAQQLVNAKTIGKVWVQGRYDPTTWQAAPSTSNLVLGLTAAHEGNRSEYTDGYHRTPTTVLTDGAVPSSEIVAGAGLTTEEKTQIFEALDGNVLTWNLAQASDVYGLNLYSRSTRSDNNGGTDSSHDAIVVNSIEVLPASESNWVSIGAPAISFGVQDGISGGALAAKLVDGTGAPLATGVTAIRFTQGACENGASLLVEAEVLGCAAAEQPDQPEEPEEPEEIPVYTLTIPAKTGLVLDSVTTNSVPVEAAENAYSIVSNTEVTITFTAASGYELDGNGGIVKKIIEANYTFVDADYPAVKEQGGGEDPVDPPPGPQPGELVNGRANMKGWAMKRISTASKVASETGFGWTATDNPSSKSYSSVTESVMTFKEAQVVNTIQLFAPPASKDGNYYKKKFENAMVSAFNVYGSNNGSDWVSLLSVTGEADWLSFESRYYTFRNEAAYTQYKLVVVGTVGGGDSKLGVYNYFFAKPADPTKPWTWDASKNALTRDDQSFKNPQLSGGYISLQYGNNSGTQNETLYDLDFSAGVVDTSGNPMTEPLKLTNGNGIKQNPFVTRLIIGDYPVTISGDQAFQDLTYLFEAELGTGTTLSGKETFKQCYSLNTIDISKLPAETIDHIFLSCYNLSGEMKVGNPKMHTTFATSSLESVDFEGVTEFGDGNDWLGTFDCCRQLKTIVLGSTLRKINGGKTFGYLMTSEGSAGVEIYWKSAPPEFYLPNGLFHEAGGNIYTNYLPLTYKAEWTAFANNHGISNFTLVLPETDDGVGTWTSGSTQVVKWWDDAEEPEEPEVPVYALTIPTKAGLTLVSVETNGVEVAAVEGVYSIVSNTEVTVTFAAAGGYELTGSGVVVLTVDADTELPAAQYPAVREHVALYVSPTAVTGVGDGSYANPYTMSEAWSKVEAGETIQLLDGTYVETVARGDNAAFTVRNKNNVTFQGNVDHPENVIIDFNGSNIRGFYSPEKQFTIRGITFQNKMTSSSPGVIATGGTSSTGPAVVENCRFLNIKTTATSGNGDRGTVFSWGMPTNCIVRNCVFDDVDCYQWGVMYVTSGSLTLSHCTVTNCVSRNGNGSVVGLNGGKALTIEDSDFIGCEAVSGSGGVIFEHDNHSPPIVIRRSRFWADPDIVLSRAGFVRLSANQSLTLEDCEFYDFKTSNWGGLVDLSGASGSLSMTRCVVSNCTATTDGGVIGVSKDSAKVVLNDNHFIDCLITGSGTTMDVSGGIMHVRGSNQIIAMTNCVCECTTSGNAYNGGFVYIYEGTGITTTVERCVFRGGLARNAGGAIFTRQKSGAMTIRNTLFTGCDITANTSNGGTCIFSAETSDIAIENCTFADNTPVKAGSSVTPISPSSGTSKHYVKNCIFWNNKDNGGAGTSRVTSKTANTIFENCVADVSGLTGVTQISASPFVDAENGDYTLAPLVGDVANPCIDTGVTLDWMTGALDLAGATRVFGSAPDLGVYEYGAIVPNFLMLSDATVVPDEESADLSVVLSALGNDPATAEEAAYADITLAWGLAQDQLCAPVAVSNHAVKGDVCSKTISGLSAATTYYYEFAAVNDLGAVTNVTGSFTTLTPVYTLTIPTKEGLTLVSVETNGVAVVPAGGVYSVYSNAQVTVTFAAEDGYELTGSGAVVLTIDGNKAFGESDYPEFQLKPVLDYWVYDSTANTLTWGANVISNVTASGKNLTIGNNQANPLAVDLDFSKTIDGDYHLVLIDYNAFQNNAAVSRFIAPASLTTIRNNAFAGCLNLTLVDLNEGLTSLGNEAFIGDTALTTIGRLPSTLTSYGNNTISGCSSLTGDIVWPSAISTYKLAG